MPKRPAGGKPKAAATRSVPRAAQSDARAYEHPEADSPLRPDVGVQKQFKGKKPPKQYRYDSSLSPAVRAGGGARAQTAALRGG
jgi:adenine-specific DNA-methyltransferase